MATITTLAYTIRFLTPAFLGDAEQSGRWRTPPFKAQLRQWWRVVYAEDRQFKVDVEAMQREEGLLFGNAWLSHKENGRAIADHSKSLVRLRLDRWESGKETKQVWGRQELDKTKEGVSHPEAGTIGPKLYLGYGPLIVEKVQHQHGKKVEYATVLKNNAAIQVGESATLSIAVPDEHAAKIQRVLWLMDRYGTVGGRSRNGWGSYELSPLPQGEGSEAKVPLRDWKQCLALDWPHAIGQDEKCALIWQTAPHNDWKALMKTLAIIKIGLRTQFAFSLVAANGDKQLYKNGQPAGIEHGKPQDRHFLAYPVTRHSVRPWDVEFISGKKVSLNLRLPNQLRFKVRKTADNKLIGVIFHMPHLPPAAFNPNRSAIEAVWRCVHQFLDALTEDPSKRLYCEKADGQALAKQKAQLDGVRLERAAE